MKKIGSIIKYLRKSKKISQEDLADFLGCSREFISQIERGTRTLPEYYIIPLSNFLNYDIKTLVKNIDEYKSFEHYILSYELIDCIESKNNEELDRLLKNDVIINEFDYGNPKVLKLYSSALVEKYINNDIEASTNICITLLEINSINEIQHFSPKLHKENRYYSTILVLGANLHLRYDYEKHKILLANSIAFLEENIFNNAFPNSSISFFFKKFYIYTLNNYSDVLFRLEDYPNSLTFANKALSIASKYNIFFMIDMILKLKVEILCNLGEFAEAKETYITFKCICQLNNNNNYFANSTKAFLSKYPCLFD